MIVLIGIVAFVLVWVGISAAAQAASNRKALKDMDVEIARFERVAAGLVPEEREGARKALVRKLYELKAKVKLDRRSETLAADKIQYVANA
jgi:uncharacterized membrane protein